MRFFCVIYFNARNLKIKSRNRFSKSHQFQGLFKQKVPLLNKFPPRKSSHGALSRKENFSWDGKQFQDKVLKKTTRATNEQKILD